MALSIQLSILTARLQLIADPLALGGEFRIYGGNKPSDVSILDLSANTLLATLPLSIPAATVTDATLTFNAITDDLLADATGSITWFRCVDVNGDAVFDGQCGTFGSGLDLIFDNLAVTQGGLVQVNLYSISETSV